MIEPEAPDLNKNDKTKNANMQLEIDINSLLEDSSGDECVNDNHKHEEVASEAKDNLSDVPKDVEESKFQETVKVDEITDWDIEQILADDSDSELCPAPSELPDDRNFEEDSVVWELQVRTIDINGKKSRKLRNEDLERTREDFESSSEYIGARLCVVVKVKKNGIWIIPVNNGFNGDWHGQNLGRVKAKKHFLRKYVRSYAINEKIEKAVERSSQPHFHEDPKYKEACEGLKYQIDFVREYYQLHDTDSRLKACEYLTRDRLEAKLYSDQLGVTSVFKPDPSRPNCEVSDSAEDLDSPSCEERTPSPTERIKDLRQTLVAPSQPQAACHPETPDPPISKRRPNRKLERDKKELQRRHNVVVIKDNGLVTDHTWAVKWFKTRVLKDHLRRIISGKVRSKRHDLYMDPRQRRLVGNVNSPLMRLCKFSYIDDDSIYEIVQNQVENVIFPDIFKDAVDKLQDLVQNLGERIKRDYCTFVLIPEGIIRHIAKKRNIKPEEADEKYFMQIRLTEREISSEFTKSPPPKRYVESSSDEESDAESCSPPEKLKRLEM